MCESLFPHIFSSSSYVIKPRTINRLTYYNRKQGQAKKIFESKVRPILEAAKCTLDVQSKSTPPRILSPLLERNLTQPILPIVTTHRFHAKEIANILPLSEFDAIIALSGDGLPHEIINGLASREDAVSALQMPVVPIPTGSANGFNVNLHGIQVSTTSL